MPWRRAIAKHHHAATYGSDDKYISRVYHLHLLLTQVNQPLLETLVLVPLAN